MHVYDGHGGSSELAVLNSLHSSPLTFIEVNVYLWCINVLYQNAVDSTTASLMQWCQVTRQGCWNTGVAHRQATPSPSVCTFNIRWILTSMSLSRCVCLFSLCGDVYIHPTAPCTAQSHSIETHLFS